jgi:hypothetical protein
MSGSFKICLLELMGFIPFCRFGMEISEENFLKEKGIFST